MSHISHTDSADNADGTDRRTDWQTKRNVANKTVNVFPKICLPSTRQNTSSRCSTVVVVVVVVGATAVVVAVVAWLWLIHANLFGN